MKVLQHALSRNVYNRSLFVIFKPIRIGENLVVNPAIRADSKRLTFDQKFRNFRNGDKWYGNFLKKVPENPEIVEFPKSEPFNRQFRKFRDENQMKRKFPGFGYACTSRGIYANSQFSTRC